MEVQWELNRTVNFVDRLGFKLGYLCILWTFGIVVANKTEYQIKIGYVESNATSFLQFASVAYEDMQYVSFQGDITCN